MNFNEKRKLLGQLMLKLSIDQKSMVDHHLVNYGIDMGLEQANYYISLNRDKSISDIFNGYMIPCINEFGFEYFTLWQK